MQKKSKKYAKILQQQRQKKFVFCVNKIEVFEKNNLFLLDSSYVENVIFIMRKLGSFKTPRTVNVGNSEIKRLECNFCCLNAFSNNLFAYIKIECIFLV